MIWLYLAGWLLCGVLGVTIKYRCTRELTAGDLFISLGGLGALLVAVFVFGGDIVLLKRKD